MEISVIIGYTNGTSGKDNKIPVLLTLEIPQSANTNLDREGIVDKNNAEYNTDEFKIISIVDEDLNEYCICSFDDFYDYELNKSYHETSNFHLNKKIVIMTINDIYRTKEGVILRYYENGQKEEEFYLNKKGKKDGKYTSWDLEGFICEEKHFLNNRLDGEYKDYEEGILTTHVLYCKGEIVEYLDFGLTKIKIDELYDSYIYKMGFLTEYDLTKPFVIADYKRDIVGDIYHKYDYFVSTLNSIDSSNKEINKYKNTQIMNFSKIMFDTLNTLFCKSYLLAVQSNNNNVLKNKIKLTLNNLIKEYQQLPEQEFREYAVYLSNIKEILFT